MSEKKRVFNVSASFGCTRILTLETAKEVINHIEAEVGEVSEFTDIGDSITITIGEMTQAEIDALPEFDGC